MKNVIHLNSKKVKFDTAPEFYGLFFEDINHAADGGLYPEMLRNRAFEDSLLPEGCTTDELGKTYVTEYGWPGAFNNGEGMDDWAMAVKPTDIPAWYTKNAKMTMVTEGTLNKNRLAALEVLFECDGEISNIGYSGVPVKEGEEYNFYCMIKSEKEAVITVSLKSEDDKDFGSSKIKVEKSDEYIRYDCKLIATDTDYKGKLAISCDVENKIVFGFTSLLPEKTFKNHGLREDLAMALKNTHSKFIRFPGGCVVEGINEQNALIFSRTIGPVWERPSSFLMWHYRTTNGLGFHEYLQLCEDLDMEAMYVCNCGMSCQARHGGALSDEITKKYLGEALNALEYALGTTDTKYGKMRAENGRIEPFKLKYVEIGNENFGPEYNKRYKMFYDTLKEKYPDIIYISNSHTERDGLVTEIADEHYYNAPEFFLENGDLFDDYDRNGPKIFLGEYAVNGGNTLASMECAMAEAAFLLGAERNQDIVKLTAYAPLFQNADYTAWKPNMIVFDNHQVYGIPSYHAVSLLAKYRGDKVIEIVDESEMAPPIYKGIPGIMCKSEGMLFKNVKIDGKDAEVSKCVYGDVIKKDDAYTIIQGEKRHRWTGKSKEWNEAFEKFLGVDINGDNPVLWAVFGDEDMEEYTFEADIKIQKDNPLTLSIWNYHPETDAGCNEPKDKDWNLGSVRNQVWQIKDGIGQTRVPRFFDKPLKDNEKTEISIDYDKYNHYKIVCNNFGFECYINDELVQKKVHALHPVTHTVATMDDENIYLKIVNVSGEDKKINLQIDCPVEKEYTAEVLSGEPERVNSFENKENASVNVEKLVFDDEMSHVVKAYSVSVLVIKKSK